MPSTNRTGRVSSIDYEAGTYEVTYFDRGQSVTRQINAMSNGEYKMPKIGQMVSVSHQSNGTAAATTTGTVWNKTNKPAEGYKGLYRKDFGSSKGKAYDRYDENTGVFKRIVDGEIYEEAAGPATLSGGGQVQLMSRKGSVSVQGKTGVGIVSEQSISAEAGTIINFTSAGAFSVNAGRDITLTVGGTSVSVGAGGTVKITGASKVELSAPEIALNGSSKIDLTAPTVNITGSGAVNISGADGDATIKGKSLVTHTHTDSMGGSTTGPT